MNTKLAKTALISGATSGIGRSAALQLLSDGWNVIAFSEDRAACKQFNIFLSKIYELNRFLVLTGDVTSFSQMKRIVSQSLKKFKNIDVVINNAGVGYYTNCDDIDEPKLKKMIDVNVLGPMNLTAAAVPSMKRRKRGMVINVVSTAGKSVSAFGVFYGATKFALSGYTEGIRRELKPYGIKVAALCPGMTNTSFLDAKQIAYRKKHIWGNKMPAMLSVEDVGRTISFMCNQSDSVVVEELTLRPFESIV